jgi:hypothetical protein
MPRLPDFRATTLTTGEWRHQGRIYVGINEFGNNSNPRGKGGFINNYMFLLPKDAIYTGSGFGFQFYHGFTVGGPR